MKCTNCKSELQTEHSFCPHCGFDLRIRKPEIANKITNSEEIPPLIEDPELMPPPIENNEQEQTVSSTYKETYLSGIKTTFIWSIVISIITIFIYFLKGRADTDLIAMNLIQGLFARPIGVFFWAFIVSLFFSKKTETFNSVCMVAMTILTVVELVTLFMRNV